jgi:hypothetical protein
VASLEIDLDAGQPVADEDIEQAALVAEEIEKQLQTLRIVDVSTTNFRVVSNNEYQSAMMLIQDILSLNQHITNPNEQNMSHALTMLLDQNKVYIEELK